MLKFKWRAETGQILPMLPAVIVVLFAVAGGVLDLGNAYLTQTRLQSALDSGALAAAQDLARGQSQSTAVNDANNLVHTNGFPDLTFDPNNPTGSQQMIITDSSGVTVKLYAKTPAPTYFMRFFGKKNIPVSTNSEAAAGGVKGASGVLPIGVPCTNFTDTATCPSDLSQLSGFSFGTEYTFTYAPGDGNRGNYGFLTFPNGANKFYSNMQSGYPGSLYVGENDINTWTGTGSGPKIYDDINTRISQTTPSWCGSWDTFSTNYKNYPITTCSRVVEVPIIEYLDKSGNPTMTTSGNTQVEIVGFGVYYLEGFDKKTNALTGRFLETLASGDVGGPSTYGATTVKLVNPS